MSTPTVPSIVLQCRNALRLQPDARYVPRLKEDWAQYIRHLRKNVFGLTQEEFWKLFDVKLPTGAKYENLTGGRYARSVPEAVIKQILSTFELEWAVGQRYGRRDADSGTYRVNSDGIHALELLDQSNIEPKDLRALVQLHKYYLNK